MSPAISSQKRAGAYYTPDAAAAALVRWALRDSNDRMLDPSCGDGRFIAQHRNSVGIEQDVAAARIAMERAPGSLVHEGEFFSWASSTIERFDCAVGNPPFIRYQTFKGRTRERALSLCNKLGASFSGLASSWAPFLVATASLLLPGGRMAFIVPAEIGHAPYAAPLLEYLTAHFSTVHVVAVRDKLFPELSEDCWLLYADGFAGATGEIAFSVLDQFKPTARPPRAHLRISLTEWRTLWKRRLRPFLLSETTRELYREVISRPDTRRFGELAAIGIGYVSGSNAFFHMRPSEAAERGIPDAFLYPTVRNGRVLPPRRVTAATVDSWRRADEPILLLRIPKDAPPLPKAVRRYLETDDGYRVREGYKCRMREPWYSVPDVQIPDFFLTYMSGREPSLVRNDAGCTCTNSVHSVRVRDRAVLPQLLRSWGSSFVRLSCEIEGHPLGGGLLKLEPREATAIALPHRAAEPCISSRVIEDGIAVMHAWRHYGDQQA
jgi:adenine-specific DNA-methyltransferase